jgi:peptidoglycan/xylan/chitin deacetylase (PgdA/CDA1 family)
MTDDGPDVTRRMRWDQHAEASAEANNHHRYPRPEPEQVADEIERSADRLHRWGWTLAIAVLALLLIAASHGPW